MLPVFLSVHSLQVQGRILTARDGQKPGCFAICGANTIRFTRRADQDCVRCLEKVERDTR